MSKHLLSIPKAKELYIESLELSLYNDLMDYQFYDVLEQLVKKFIINKEINEKVEKEKIWSQPEEIDKALNLCKEGIQKIEDNEDNIPVLTKVNAFKDKYKGTGMFEVITH